MSEPVIKVLVLILCLSQVQGDTHCEALFLTPLIKNGSAIEARELSVVDKGEFLGIHSHSGFITVKEKYQSNLFFWYFPHEDVPSVPWIIWLNGGPGASSLIGLFSEIGPIQIENGTVKKRNTTWALDYSLLFVDSPVGAGFSFTKHEDGYTSNEDQVSQQLYEFLQQFLVVFPEQREAPLFIVGQSYAGKYVPAFAMQVHKNSDQKNPIKLKGIAMGNALVDPREMMHYSDVTKHLGLLVDDQLQELIELENSTVKLIDEGKMVDAANKYNETIEYIKKKTSVSIYNYMKDPSGLDANSFEEFVNRPEMRKAIHVGNVNFDYNNQLVYEKMLPDIMNTTKPMVEEMLGSYGVMFYHGQLDLFIPFSLSKRMYNKLQWAGSHEFRKASRRRLRHYPDDKVVGYKKAGGNLVEVMIRGCGHMVPAEEPDVAKYIIDLFIEKFK